MRLLDAIIFAIAIIATKIFIIAIVIIKKVFFFQISAQRQSISISKNKEIIASKINWSLRFSVIPFQFVTMSSDNDIQLHDSSQKAPWCYNIDKPTSDSTNILIFLHRA